MRRRENTFRIDYVSVPKKPDYAKVHKFCGTVLGLKQGEVLRIQCSRSLGCAFVKVADLELAQKVCDENDGKHEMTIDGKKYPLRITMEDGAVEVKLFDLSEDVSDERIAEFLGKYGDVMSVREQMCGADLHFAGISTGVRIVKMVVKRNIESWVTIDGELTLLSYFGQRQTCRHCRDFIHIGASCVQNKKLLVQKSYADAAKQPAPPPTFSKTLPKMAKPMAPKPKPSTSGLSAVMPVARTRQQQKQLMPPPSSIDMDSDKIFPSLPPPSGSSQPSDCGSLAITPGQRPPASGGAVCKPASGKPDGNDTDTSSASSNSKRGRPPGKKRREDSDEERDEDYRPRK